MLRSLLLLFVLLAATGLPAATAQSSCATALADGQNAYDDARFDDAVRVLERCVAALPLAEQRTAYRLMALSHLGSGNQPGAQEAVRNLLRVDPGYRTDPATDPPAFARLVQDVRASGPAPAASASSPARSASMDMASNTSGFFGQLGLGYTSISTTLEDETDSEAGGGATILLGYGITPGFALFAHLGAASLAPEEGDSYTHSEVGLGLRYHFGSASSKLRPYVQISAVQQTATFEDVEDGAGGTLDIDVTGVAGRLGGGVLYFFSPMLALHGELNASAGEYSKVSGGGETVDTDDFFGETLSTAGLYVRVGITAFPFR